MADTSSELPRCSCVKGRYHAPWDRPRPGFRAIAKWKMSSKAPVVPPVAELATVLPLVVPDAEQLRNPPADGVQVTWIGHATVLVQMCGVNFLTDPIWSQRCAPVQFAGPKRYQQVPIAIPELPRIDFVVISHNHYDHLDKATVRALGNGPRWYVPLGLGEWFEGESITNYVEVDWWQTVDFNADIRVSAACAQHWSKRYVHKDNDSLWCSWAVRASDGTSFWFAGDTGYNEAFKHIGREFGPFTVAAIPVGAYEPRDLMCFQHVNPEEAVQIHEDVRAETSVGVHWGTFILTDEPILEPPVRVAEEVKRRRLDPDSFVCPPHGEVRFFPVSSRRGRSPPRDSEDRDSSITSDTSVTSASTVV